MRSTNWLTGLLGKGTRSKGKAATVARRRTAHAPAAHTALESAEHAIGAASLATQDTVKVAVEGYSAASRRELRDLTAGSALTPDLGGRLVGSHANQYERPRRGVPHR